MPTLRELTETIQHRAGVRSVVLLGADGLVIDAHGAPAADAEALAARVPALLAAAGRLGETTGGGDARVVVLELERGYAVVMGLTEHATLLATTDGAEALPELLFDLRRHRAPMTALVQ